MRQLEMGLHAPLVRLPGVSDQPHPDDPEATAALFRVLGKAREQGVVRRAGVYADRAQERCAKLPGFDWQMSVDRCVALGWLAPAAAFNTYEVTPRGAAALREAEDAGVAARRQGQ